MIDKTITLLLGGQERTLLYGTMGYFTHIKDAAGMEPFEWLRKFDETRAKSATENITIFIEDAVVLIYAGLNSQLDNLDQPNIPLAKVRKWCNTITFDDFGKIMSSVMLSAFGTIQTSGQTDEPGELAAQPAQSNGEAKVPG